MRQYNTLAMATLSVVFALAITSCEVDDLDALSQPYLNGSILPSDVPTPVFGDGVSTPLSGWTKEWWKYTLSMECSLNPLNFPILPRVPEQNGPVVFLIGSASGQATRNIIISTKQAILVPVMNTLQFYPCIAPEIKTEGESQALLAKNADRYIDLATNMKAGLDGKAIRITNNHRVATGNFYLRGNEDLVNCSEYCLTGEEQVVASDGYWLFIKGLTKGEHILRIHGEILQTGVVVDAYYYITVHQAF